MTDAPTDYPFEATLRQLRAYAKKNGGSMRTKGRKYIWVMEVGGWHVHYKKSRRKGYHQWTGLWPVDLLARLANGAT